MSDYFIAIKTVEQAIERLANLSPDGASLRNDVGFNGTHAGPGLKLAASRGFWDVSDLVRAAEICQVYKHTQLHGLGVPTPEEIRAFPEITQYLADQREAKIEQSIESGFGLAWGPAKIVRLANGTRKQVENAEPNEAFWCLWRTAKDAIKGAGFGVSRDPRSNAWQVSRWSAAPAEDSVRAQANFSVAHRTAACAAALANPAGLDEGKLLSYQPDHVRNLARAYVANGGYLWDGSDLGTGKTYQTCALIAWAGFKRVRVVCPKALIDNRDWEKAAAHFGLTLASIASWELVRRGTDYALRSQVGRANSFQWVDTDFVVFDEAHNAKGDGTLNSRLVKSVRDSGVEGILLTGTIGHEPQEFRAANHFLGVCDWRNHWDWTLQNGCSRGPWGLEFAGTDAAKRLKMAALRGSYIPSRGARITVASLPPGAFPETRISGYFAGGDEQTRAGINAAYDDLADELAALAERSAGVGNAAALVALLRALQKCELLLVPTMVNLAVENWESNERKTVVFLNFRESIAAAKRLFAERTGRVVPVVIGGQKPEVRREAISEYNEDRSPWLLCGVAAGGTGCSFHHLNEYPSDSLLTPNASAIKIKQVLGRVRRGGGKSTSIQRIVCIADTKQAEMLKRCISKIACMAAFNDADLHGDLFGTILDTAVVPDPSGEKLAA